MVPNNKEGYNQQMLLGLTTQNKDVAIGTFTISFIQRKDIIDLINTFIENREGLSDQQLAREVILYFEKTYGKTTPKSKAEISTIIANINGL